MGMWLVMTCMGAVVLVLAGKWVVELIKEIKK